MPTVTGAPLNISSGPGDGGAARDGIEEVVVAGLKQGWSRRAVFDHQRRRCHREAGPVAPQCAVVDAHLDRIGGRSRHALIGQLRKLGRGDVDFLIVRFDNPIEDKVAGASVLKRVGRDRVAVGIGGRKQRRRCNRGMACAQG